MRILLTGGTGYVGGRLVPRLLQAGHDVAVLVRSESGLARHPWAARVEHIVGDLLEPASLPARFDGFDAAYYLVHSLHAGRGFDQLDRQAARNFARAGRDLPRVVYLGGLQHKGRPSRHLASRAEVGGILASSMPTLELRCGPVIGSGSASFEVCRYLVERLPVMLAPRWIDTPVSPIGVRDVLEYLVRALDVGALGVVDIGAEPITFRDIMIEYARLRGLRRSFVPIPLFSSRLAARWIELLTPVTSELVAPLVLGMTSPLPADTARARALFPSIAPMPYAQAVLDAS